MVRKVIVALLVMVCVSGAQRVFAGARATQEVKFEHADRNDDGKVDRKEMKMERRFETEKRSSWHQTKSAVNTPVEHKYDANGDGVLEPAEAKQMLQDKHTLISTQGKAKVDSALEARYDTNKDGVIDSSEAGALQADLKN
jgi:hypothetical protein